MKKLVRIILPFLVFLFISGGIRVLAQAPVFTAGSVLNTPGPTIVIPITSTNFIQFLAWQGSFNWDNSKLNYAGISAPIAQLNGIQFNQTVSSNTGRLSFVWVDNNLTPQTIANNAVLFSITFNVVSGASGTTNILFSNTPTQLLLSDANGAAVNNVSYVNGTVSFQAPFIPPEFTIGSLTNVSGSTIVVPVTTKSFFQLLGWQGSVNWDNSKLTYSGISGTLSQLNGIQFSPSVNAGTGRLAFTWVESNLTPQTIPDSNVLFNIIFNVANGVTGSTDIIFSGIPTPLIVSDANSATVNNVVYKKGTIYFQGAVIPPEFIIGSAYNVSTSTLTIPVTTRNFAQLLGLQGSISWDNTRLTYSGTNSIISQLAGIQFNPSLSGSTGSLSFLWTDNNLVPQTIPDNALLFNITFTVSGSNSGITYLNFTNSPTQLLVLNSLGAGINNVTYTKGTVTFSANICPGGSTTTTSNITGISYQWQLNSGSGFVNISDNINYSGTTTQTLGLNNLPSSLSGNQYRCMVNGLYSNVFILHFKNYWTGGSGTAWENPVNWLCGQLPDAYTDVIINNGTLVINSNVIINSLTLAAGVSVTVLTGRSLTIKH